MRRLQVAAILLVSVLVAVAVGCTERVELESLNIEECGVSERVFSLSLPLTKADMDESLVIVWKVGDELSVYDPIAKVGRKFTVISVSSGEATVKGSISAGEFSFSAVYPYEVVSSWTDGNTPVIDVPMEQVIPTGGKVDKRALICGAFNVAQGSDICMESLYSLVSFSVPQDDVDEVTITLAQSGSGAETYSVRAEEGTFSEGKYYSLVKPGSYAGGISMKGSTIFDTDWTRSTQKTFSIGSAECIDLGSIREGKKHVSYVTTSQGSVTSVKALIKGSRYYSILVNKAGKVGAELALSGILTYYFFTTQNDDVYTYNFTFTTAGIDGLPMTQSARLYIPKEAVTKGKTLSGLILGNRATITKNEECPTMCQQVHGALAWKGYAVVLPDFYGFGADNQHFQAFLNSPLIGRNNADALQAAQQIIEDMKLSFNGKLINLGYSQGGMASIATLKYALAHPETGITFAKTFSGGGPYNYNSCYDAYMSSDFKSSSQYIAIAVASLNESENMGLDYSKIYKGSLLANYKEWILSKKYDIYELKDLFGGQTVNDFLQEDIVMKRSAEAKAITDAMEGYSLVKDNLVLPAGSELYLFHSTTDDCVPYVNYTALKAVTSGGSLHFYSDDYGDHMTAVLDYAKIILGAL